jgi:hypothetical protein
MVGAKNALISAAAGSNFMIKLTSQPNRTKRSPHRWRRIFVLLVLGLLTALVIEHWRGQLALGRWKSGMAAKGEILEVTQLWPPASQANTEFSNRLTQVTASLRGRLSDYAGQLSGIVTETTGQYRRGSQEPRPPRQHGEDATNTWKNLDELLQQNERSLQSLRELMKQPSPSMGRDIVKSLEDPSIPSMVGMRLGAQILHAAALNDLHNHDHEKAVQDLATLLAFARLYEQDPSLVNFMIRMAIVGLSVDVCWDAVQANGWTEPQLAALQQACLDTDRVLPQIARTMESVRADRIYQYEWLRSHSYQAWVDRYREVLQGFGAGNLCPATAPPLRQWVSHPIWSYAWADQEELIYLVQSQREIAVLREAGQQRSWLWLQAQIVTQQKGYQRPTAAWRFYGELPVIDRISEVIGTPHTPEPAYPFPDFTRAWFTTLGNLTRHELVFTAIALKRYALRAGRSPDQLADLVPEFLTGLPTDLMDGQPLRYRLNQDGTFLLYSVGANLRDDGGDFVLVPTEDQRLALSPWTGRDWVWLHRETRVQDSPTPRIALQSGSK